MVQAPAGHFSLLIKNSCLFWSLCCSYNKNIQSENIRMFFGGLGIDHTTVETFILTGRHTTVETFILTSRHTTAVETFILTGCYLKFKTFILTGHYTTFETFILTGHHMTVETFILTGCYLKFQTFILTGCLRISGPRAQSSIGSSRIFANKLQIDIKAVMIAQQRVRAL